MCGFAVPRWGDDGSMMALHRGGWRGIVSVTTYSSKHARGERPSFGDLLRRYRVAAGLSQEALAERARMSARAISDLERGVHRLPYKDTVAQLAAALELDASERALLEAAARGPRDAATVDDRG